MKRVVLIVSGSALSLAAVAGHASGNHVVELFTSQGCYSCPPADRLLGDLIDARSDVVALEFHVDYWDELVYGSAGRWEDPFSDSAYTRRQQRYRSRGLEGNNGVYTPQAVVNGRQAVVGSKRGALNALLEREAPATAAISLENGAGALRVAVSGDPGGAAEVWLYRFDTRRVTEIRAGENQGKTLTNHHVVRETRRLGQWRGHEQQYIVDDFELAADQGCAVVVQRPGQGPVLGAALCM